MSLYSNYVNWCEQDQDRADIEIKEELVEDEKNITQDSTSILYLSNDFEDNCYTSEQDPLKVDFKVEVKNETEECLSEKKLYSASQRLKIEPENLSFDNRNVGEVCSDYSDILSAVDRRKLYDVIDKEPQEYFKTHSTHFEDAEISQHNEYINECELLTPAIIAYNSLVCQQENNHSEKPFKCQNCEKSFRKPSLLKTHLRVHTGEKPFNCNFCEKSFSRSSHLKDHMNIHTGKKPFKCKNCEKSFSLWCHLRTHMRVHTDKTFYNCNYCKKSFTVFQSLKKHLWIYHL